MSQHIQVESPMPRGVPWGYWAKVVCVVIFLALMVYSSALNIMPREAVRRSRCVQNLKQISIALQIYHDEHKSFPPAVTYDEHGKSMHSWRAILLPYCEDEECASLARQYRLDEPWNGPNNCKLLDKTPRMFLCPSDDGNTSETNYVAVTGTEAIWRGAVPVKIREITDGTTKSIAVVECADSGINWLEPRDVAFNDAMMGINKISDRPGIRSSHPGGTMALFADGSVHFLSHETKLETLRAFLTAAGGEKVDIPE